MALVRTISLDDAIVLKIGATEVARVILKKTLGRRATMVVVPHAEVTVLHEAAASRIVATVPVIDDSHPPVSAEALAKADPG